MDSLSSSSFYPIPAIGVSRRSNRFPVRRWGSRIRPHRILVFSKKSYFTDFQDYAKPRRLLPTMEPELFVDRSPEKIISSLQLDDGSQCLYKVLLRTSSTYGSGLSDVSARILVCVIDENGDSILERIPAILGDGVVHFQKGKTDEFIFTGPKLGRIEAVWISPESGTWRVGGANLTIVTTHSDQESPYHSISYNFEVEDVLLGEGGDMLMAELRPCSVTEYSGTDFSVVASDASVKSLAEKGITKEGSMKEYTNLKYSLLLYDAMLIFAGTSFASSIGGENTALAFLIGGITGFLYLLLLQRSVDGLSDPESNLADTRSSFGGLFGGIKDPLLVVAIVFVIGVLLVKHNVPEIEAGLTPKEIVVGMMGFLTCKVSVLLAAFKPIPMGMEDTK